MNSVKTCATCSARGSITKGVKYCFTCLEYLCKDCTEIHKFSKATRSHTLIDPDHIDMSDNLLADMEKLQFCETHARKTTEYFCYKHQQFFCSKCLLYVHKNCPYVVDIESTGEHLLKVNFIGIVEDSLKSYISSTKQILEQTTTYKTLETFSEEMKRLRDKIVSLFDEQIELCSSNLATKIQTNDNHLMKTQQEMKQHIESVAKYESLLKTIIEAGKKSDIFRCSFLLQTHLAMLQESVEDSYADKMPCALELSIEKTDLLEKLSLLDSPLAKVSCNEKPFECEICEHTQVLQDSVRKRFKTYISQCSENIRRPGLSVEYQYSSNDADDEDYQITDKRLAQESKFQTDIDTDTVANRKQEELSTMDRHKGTCDKRQIDDFPGVPCISRHKIIPCSAPKQSETSSKSDKTVKIDKEYKIKILHLFSIKISDKEIEKPPWVGGIVCLPDGRLVLSDFLNSCLRVVKLSTNENQFYETKYAPGFLTLLHDKETVAVCLLKTSQILLLRFASRGVSKSHYVTVPHHPKCVCSIDADRLLVSSLDSNEDWHLNIVSLKGEKTCSLPWKGLYDCYKLGIQPVPGANGEFRILMCCEINNRLTCHTEDGACIFRHSVHKSSSVITDSKGYIYIVRFTGEIQVLSPNGNFLGKMYNPAMFGAKFAAFDDEECKLYITIYKSPHVHVVKVARSEI